MTVRDWATLKAPDFAALDPETTVVVQPLAAIEQHGGHLPVGTDTLINEGLWVEAAPLIDAGVTVLTLPMQAVGKSDEHLGVMGGRNGTLHVEGEVVSIMLHGIGRSVARAGLRKLLILNSHGGNSEAIAMAGRRLRQTEGMFVVPTSWSRMGLPDGLIDEDETRHGIHGGEIETALMLHLHPHLVDMDRAPSGLGLGATLAAENEVLRADGRTGFSWMMDDLSPSGVTGHADRATVETGAVLAAHAAQRMATLIEEMARFPLERLAAP